MDTKTKRVLGYVDLVGVREISEKEYCDWHATGKYSGLTLTIPEEKRSPHYYAYDFENPRFEPHPYNISPKEGERVWVYIGEPNLQGTLF